MNKKSLRIFNDFVHDVGKLKRKDRAGWVRHQIETPESVAEHSFRTAVLALVLAEKFGLDVNKTVKMAIIHDLAEYKVPDLTPFDNVTEEEKFRQEEQAMQKLCAKVECGPDIMSLWYEIEEGKSPEAQFIRRLDKLEMMFQAQEYAQEQPDKDLELFWEMIKGFDFGDLSHIFNSLKQGRKSDKQNST